MKSDTGKIIRRNLISRSLFQTEKKITQEQIPLTDNEIQPKNRHCLRGLDGKYGRWDEILRDILNGKLNVQTRKKTDTDTEEEEEEDDDDEKIPETTRKQRYDTSERNGRFVLIQTNPEVDALQLYTDGEISGENNKNIFQRSNRNVNKPNRYGSIPYTGNFWG